MSSTLISVTYTPYSDRAYYYRAQAMCVKAGLSKECDICGSMFQIEIHHIDTNITNNDISNLRALCKECHKNIHQSNKMEK